MFFGNFIPINKVQQVSEEMGSFSRNSFNVKKCLKVTSTKYRRFLQACIVLRIKTETFILQYVFHYNHSKKSIQSRFYLDKIMCKV